jgi:hypothetical protein
MVSNDSAADVGAGVVANAAGDWASVLMAPVAITAASTATVTRNDDMANFLSSSIEAEVFFFPQNMRVKWEP